jgi:nicotinamide mononucleotide transporter
MAADWIAENIVEIFGAVAGIAFVILEIKRNILLWPLGIITSAVYIYVFGREGFYANMGLQGYYLVISIYGWYSWSRARKERSDAVPRKRESEVRRAGGEVHTGSEETRSGSSARAQGEEHRAQSTGHREKGSEPGSGVIRIDRKTAVICLIAAIVIWGLLWFVLDRWTDSPVPLWDGLITSLSVVATWMLTRKILEQWYVWILANAIAVIVYLVMGMHPTAVLFFVYFVMAVIGVREWSRSQAVGSSEVGSPQSSVSSQN